MEILLAVVVASAVILFGALIIMGNERQRKAIDKLREQVVLWAMQDLKIKRETLAHNVRIDDPMDWLSKISTKVCGYALDLQFVEAFDEPRAILCLTRNNGGNNVVFSPISPSKAWPLIKNKRDLLSRYSNQNPILSLSRRVTTFEISALNGGILFDLELPLVWTELTGQKMELSERLWMYVLP